MIQLSIHLPKQLRLDVGLVRRRKEPSGQKLIPSVSDIKSVRSGSRISRVFTHIITHKHIKRLLGVNFAAAIIISGYIPAKPNFDLVELNIVAATNIVTKTEKGLQFPTEVRQINQGYYFFHPGVDIEGVTGDPVKPIMAGKVNAVQYSNFAYGNAILLDHGDGLQSLYAHLSRIFVKEGDDVKLNTIIGSVGSTGRSTGDHLHLEIQQNGYALNPLNYLSKDVE